MDEYMREDLIKYLTEEIKACGEENSVVRPIAYGTIIGLKSVLEYVKSMPSKDVVHGIWLELPVPPHWVYCSECNQAYVLDKSLIGKMCSEAEFCPHCGAIMDGKVD